EAFEGVGAQDVLTGVELEPAGAVHEVDERGLPMAPPCGDAAGDPVAAVGFLARAQALVRGSDLGDLGAPLEPAGKGLDAASRKRSSFRRRSATRCDPGRSVP